MKRFLSILLVLVIVITISSCGTGSSSGGGSSDASKNVGNVNKEGFPIVKEQITLDFAVMQTPVQETYDKIEILKNYEEKSNIKINWTSIPSEFVAERRNLMMASGEDLPDAFMKMGFPGTDVEKFSNQGLFIPLDNLIEEYAPNAKAALEEWAQVKKGLTMSDGKVHSLSYILAATPITAGTKLFINEEALKMTGLDMPKTLDEYADVLRAFKDLDYNGNGKNDEVPLTTSASLALENIFKGSFGMGTRGGAHPYVDIDPDTKDVRFLPTTDNTKEMWQYLNSLYKEGLIDSDIFSKPDDMPALIAKGEEGRALSYIFVNHAIIGAKYSEKSTGLHQPFEGNYGKPVASQTGSSLSGVGNFIITSSNEHPEATIRWVDYFYSDEGIRDYFMGIEGVTYEVNADGEYVYTDYVMNNPDGIMFEQVLGKYVPWAGGGNPSIANEKYFKGGEMQPISKQASEYLEPYRPTTIWPQFLWSEEYNEDIKIITADIKTYFDENRALFITGKRSFDEWEDYVKGFDNMRVETFMEAYSKTYKSYE